MSSRAILVENDGSFSCMDYKVGRVGRVEFVNTKKFVGVQTNFAIDDDFLPSNDPPYPELNTNAAFSMVDCFMNDDEKGFTQSMGALLDQSIAFKKSSPVDQSLVTRCQASCEKSLFHLMDLKAKAKELDRDLVFLNPNIGTLKRFYESECSLRTAFDGIDIVVTEDDRDYIKRITYYLNEIGVKKVIRVVDYGSLDPSVFYYGSFGGGRMVCKGLPYYISFEVSPHALAYHGQQINTYKETLGLIEFTYLKGYREISAIYSRKSHRLRYPSDVAAKYLRQSKYFWEVPMLYNLVSTFPVEGMESVGFVRSGITMESEYLICDDLSVEGNCVYGVLEDRHRVIVDTISSLSPSCRAKVIGSNYQKLDSYDVMQKATLMRNEAFNAIVHLGQKYKAIKVNNRAKRYDVKYKGEKYRICSIFTDGGVVVKEDYNGEYVGDRCYTQVYAIPICDNLCDWIGSDYYQSATNSDLVGTVIEYEVDNNIV